MTKMLVFLGAVFVVLGLLALLHVLAFSTTVAIVLLVIGAALIVAHYGWFTRR